MWEIMSPDAFYLMALPLVAAIYACFCRRTSKHRGITPFTAIHLKLRKDIQRTRWIFRTLFGLFLLALGLLSLAIARPALIHTWNRTQSEGIDIVVSLDVSESMEASDLKPTRIAAAKAVIRNFVQQRKEDRIGLVIFGGEAVTKSPLTRDYDFLLSQVDDVRLRELKQGTAIGMGLANAIARLRTSEAKTKVIILLTDGDSNVGAINPITAASLAKQEHIRIYTIGIGRENRVVVPIYAYDASGHRAQLVAQVPSYLNPELLAQIATLTGGKAYMAKDTGMLNRIWDEINKLEKTKVKNIPMEKREELFFWIAFLGLVLLAVIVLLGETRFRRVPYVISMAKP